MKSLNYGAYGDVIGEEGGVIKTGPGFDSSMPEVFGGAYGIRRDIITGLDYMRFRWYANDLSSFISADRIHNLNRYAYAKGNPVKYADPMGLKEQVFPNVYSSPHYQGQFIKPDGSHPVWGTSAPADRPASAYHHPDYGHSISNYLQEPQFFPEIYNWEPVGEGRIDFGACLLQCYKAVGVPGNGIFWTLSYAGIWSSARFIPVKKTLLGNILKIKILNSTIENPCSNTIMALVNKLGQFHLNVLTTSNIVNRNIVQGVTALPLLIDGGYCGTLQAVCFSRCYGYISGYNGGK